MFQVCDATQATQATQTLTNQEAGLVKFPNSKNKFCFLLSLFYQLHSYNNIIKYNINNVNNKDWHCVLI